MARALSGSVNPPLWRETRLGLELAALVRDGVFRGQGVTDGRGQPVLLIPGFMAGDDSLRVMGRWLKGTGHHPGRAGIKANVSCSGASVDRLERRLETLVERQGRRAAIVGHSRGGTFAKALAVRRPDLVAGIVTLGSPHIDPLSGVHPLVRANIEAVATLGRLRVPGMFSHRCLDDECCADFWLQASGPLPRGVGFVSVYSRSDGVVGWHSCLDPAADRHVEVRSSHCGMAVHAGVYRAVAESLQQFRRRDARRKALAAVPTRAAA